MAIAAGRRLVSASQRKIGKGMIERLGVEKHYIRLAAFVLGMAGLTF